MLRLCVFWPTQQTLTKVKSQPTSQRVQLSVFWGGIHSARNRQVLPDLIWRNFPVFQARLGCSWKRQLLHPRATETFVFLIPRLYSEKLESFVISDMPELCDFWLSGYPLKKRKVGLVAKCQNFAISGSVDTPSKNGKSAYVAKSSNFAFSQAYKAYNIFNNN